MCGRIVRTSPAEILRATFDVDDIGALDLRPRYNLCPAQDLVAVVAEGRSRVLRTFRWGFVPQFATRLTGGPQPINARAETVATARLFHDAFRARRCLVVADGFYEWQATAHGTVPHLLRLEPPAPFGLAALWEAWDPPGGEPSLHSVVILTCSPNVLVAPIHHRMPVILSRTAQGPWLDPTVHEPAALTSLLVPYPAEAMAAYPVSRLVNNPRVDVPACLAPA